MTDPELLRNPVEILAEEFLDRYRRGERPSVFEYVDGHPELAEEIGEVFPALLAVEEAGPRAASLGHSGNAARGHDRLMPDRLGDFRIIGEIGRGGMGVVYEAVQESLGRHVALKVLPLGALADPAALRRFRREARSVAALHHSNIVPVFGIGENAGYHYYAMQLIHGQTLEAVLGGVRRLRAVAEPIGRTPATETQRVATEIAGCLLSGKFTRSGAVGETQCGPGKTTEPEASTGATDRASGESDRQSATEHTTTTTSERSESRYHYRIARAGLEVAEALAYAHDQGVLHRDIKPSNLLMDEEGTVWVLDFGLAKAEGVGEHSASRDVVGTLRYMAPERFDGRSDRRSDVYGLGVTLYELLTLRPAYDAGQQAALIHQVLRGEPTSLRRIDRRIPRDLETIVLKAMAKDPSARYPSAHALGEDLRRFLENRTILARRSTSLERTTRWCRRNPVVAALLSSVVALLAFIAGHYSVSATRYRHQFERARAAEIDGREKLFSSYVAQARASRFSRRPGQRFAALRALADAAKIHRTPELRDEAIACLALPDLDEVHRSSQNFHGILLAFDPSLERYARLEWDGIVSVRRVADDSEVRRYPCPAPGPVGESFILEFSPDGRHLAVSYRLGSKNLLRVWRLDRDLPAVASDPQTAIVQALFTPDGHCVAAGYSDGSVVFHNLATGQAEARWNAGSEPMDLAISPDGRKLAVSFATDPAKIKVCAVRSGEVLHEITTPAHCKVAWGPDGTSLAAACWDSRIYVYDAESGRQTGILAGHTSVGLFASFQPAGSLLASNGWDGKLRVWRPHTGELLLTMTAGGPLDFRSDGLRLGTQTSDNYPVIFQVADGREYRSLVQSPARRRDYVTCSSIHPNGRLLAVGMTNGVGFWDIDRDVSVGSLPLGLTESVAFQPSGHLLATGRTGLTRWPVRENPGDSNSLIVGPPELLSDQAGSGLSGSRDGRLVGVSRADVGAVVWDVKQPNSQIRLGPQADVRSIAISPDGLWAATGSHLSRDGIKVWSLPDAQFVKQYPNQGMIARPVFSPDGSWLATNLGNELQLRAVGEWRDGPRMDGSALTFSPDGRLLVSAQHGGSVRLVEARSGRLVASLEDPQLSRSRHATFTADGSRLLLASEDSRVVHVWDLRAIRGQLVPMGLDWDWPLLPEAEFTEPATHALRLSIDLGGHDFSWGSSDPQELERLNEAIEHVAGDVFAMMRRGRVYHQMGRYDQAIGDFTRALAVRPGNANILGLRGKALLSQKKYAQGIAECEASLAALPDQASVHNALASAMAAAPPPFRDPAKAVRHGRVALRLAPERATYHNTLGVALFREGHYQDAVAELEKSLSAASHDDAPFDLFFLAMCHVHLENSGRAKDDFERACRLQAAGHISAKYIEDLDVIRREAQAILSASKPR